MRRTFTAESEGLQAAFATHAKARDSYKSYLADLDFVDAEHKEQRILAQSTMERWLTTNRAAFAAWEARQG
jgi:hypothetical protein